MPASYGGQAPAGRASAFLLRAPERSEGNAKEPSEAPSRKMREGGPIRRASKDKSRLRWPERSDGTAEAATPKPIPRWAKAGHRPATAGQAAFTDS
jgi:hypothetical protein